MNQELLHQSILQCASLSFARSGGPGGQNVNKVNTKVFITIEISKLEGINEIERLLIERKLATRLGDSGSLTISVTDERTQYRNREIAIARIEQIIIKASHEDKKRIKTKPGKAAKLRRLEAKKGHSRIKSQRNNHLNED